MNSKYLNVIQRLQAALDILPDAKKEYIIGYAEGVLAFADSGQADQRAQPDALRERV